MYIKVMKLGSVIIMCFVIIYLGGLIDWVFRPLVVLVQTLFLPILLAGVMYYLFRPLVQLLSRKMPRGIAILILYIALIGLGIGLISFIGPHIQKQFTNLVNSFPSIIRDLQLLLGDLQQNELIVRFGLVEFFNIDDHIEQIGNIAGGILADVFAGTIGVVSTLFNGILLLFIVPFILFYLLKEGEKFPNFVLRFFEKDKIQEIKPILTNMDKTLSSYIQGVLIVCSFIGVLYFIGFSAIGLEYALLLAIFGMITNVIPYLGPWIGAIPSVTVALIQAPILALFVIIIVVIIQQIESTFVQPQVIGKRLSIHPVTVMALVLAAGRFSGIVGMVLVIPTYAIGKVIVTHLYRLWKVRREEKIDID